MKKKQKHLRCRQTGGAGDPQPDNREFKVQNSKIFRNFLENLEIFYSGKRLYQYNEKDFFSQF